jgi:hypothetical protein
MPVKKYLKNKLAKELLVELVAYAVKRGYPQTVIADALKFSKQRISLLAKK